MNTVKLPQRMPQEHVIYRPQPHFCEHAGLTDHSEMSLSSQEETDCKANIFQAERTLY